MNEYAVSACEPASRCSLIIYNDCSNDVLNHAELKMQNVHIA